jgi:hypothetical protein
MPYNAFIRLLGESRLQLQQVVYSVFMAVTNCDISIAIGCTSAACSSANALCDSKLPYCYRLKFYCCCLPLYCSLAPPSSRYAAQKKLRNHCHRKVAFSYAKITSSVQPAEPHAMRPRRCGRTDPLRLTLHVYSVLTTC